MPPKSIPDAVKRDVERIVEQFNRDVLQKTDCCYIPRYRGRYLYLDREGSGSRSRICRLKFTGKIDAWEFAIFKYSSERYDPDEWLFPGSEFVDGTVEGAMKAGLEAYPERNFGLRWYMVPLIVWQFVVVILGSIWGGVMRKISRRGTG